ncbi:MAG TPA: hypothetical protein VM681_02675 [Candidatus Thermoplasmatota archaeon]|nr:hypothetical protein [Candidatus Thermoplasmatota archaeon]
MPPYGSYGIVALVLALSLVAGCLESAPEEGTTPSSVDPPVNPEVPEEPVEEIEKKAVELYSFAETVVGASAPHPMQPGAASDAVPLAKTDKFTVPADITKLAYEGDVGTGTGSGRIEVYDPTGKLVYLTSNYILVGVPGAAGVGVSISGDEAENNVVPGDYEVRYYVAGAMGATLLVTGK